MWLARAMSEGIQAYGAVVEQRFDEVENRVARHDEKLTSRPNFERFGPSRPPCAVPCVMAPCELSVASVQSRSSRRRARLRRTAILKSNLHSHLLRKSLPACFLSGCSNWGQWMRADATELMPRVQLVLDALLPPVGVRTEPSVEETPLEHICQYDAASPVRETEDADVNSHQWMEIADAVDVLAAELDALAALSWAFDAPSCLEASAARTVEPERRAEDSRSSFMQVQAAKIPTMAQLRAMSFREVFGPTAQKCLTCERPVLEDDGTLDFCEYCFHRVRPTLDVQFLTELRASVSSG